jgi:hypothetical protein
VSARSVLTKGSNRDSFGFSFTQKCRHAQVSCKECTDQVKFQGCEPEKSIEGLLLQVCVESKDFSTGKCLKVAARSVRKSLF